MEASKVCLDEASGDLDGMALRQWQVTQVPQAGSGSGEGGDEYSIPVVALRRWLRLLGPAYRPMAVAWLQEILAWRAAGANARLLKRLHTLMRLDVTESVAELQGASRETVAAWGRWYHRWVAAEVDALRNREPELWLSRHELAALAQKQDRDRKEVDRATALAKRLHALAQSQPDGLLAWKPDFVARVLTPRGFVPQVRPAADMLVAAGAAEWRLKPNGKPWALVAVGVTDLFISD